jgi:hypothetical protein
MMEPWWAKSHEKGVCVEAATKDEAITLAEEYFSERVDSCDRLPYPANPRFGRQTVCPSFCYSPNYCVGYRSCPKPYACSE